MHQAVKLIYILLNKFKETVINLAIIIYDISKENIENKKSEEKLFLKTPKTGLYNKEFKKKLLNSLFIINKIDLAARIKAAYENDEIYKKLITIKKSN